MIHKILLPSARTVVADFTSPTPLIHECDYCIIDSNTELITFYNGETMYLKQLIEFLKVAKLVHEATVPMRVEIKLGTVLEFSCGTHDRIMKIADQECDPGFAIGVWAEQIEAWYVA